VISNQTRAARSFDFEITRMISDQIALHLVQLPLLTSRHIFRYQNTVLFTSLQNAILDYVKQPCLNICSNMN